MLLCFLVEADTTKPRAGKGAKKSRELWIISGMTWCHVVSPDGEKHGENAEAKKWYVPGSINSHYFHIIGDGKNQPNSRGLYTHYKDSY